MATNDGHVDMDRTRGSLRAHTGDGHMSIAGRRDSLNLETGDGHVKVNLSEATQVETEKDSHHYRARLGSGGKLLTVRTGDGRITVRQK